MNAIGERRADRIERLRAALAALGIDPGDVERQIRDHSDGQSTAAEEAGVEHAMLAGLLYRSAGTVLRDSLMIGPEIGPYTAPWMAASPHSVTVAGEDLGAQAQFDTYWLQDRISVLKSEALNRRGEGDGPKDRNPTVLDVADQAAEAVRVLLDLHCGRGYGDGPGMTEQERSDVRFEIVAQRLDCARELVSRAHSRAKVMGG